MHPIVGAAALFALFPLAAARMQLSASQNASLLKLVQMGDADEGLEDTLASHAGMREAVRDAFGEPTAQRGCGDRTQCSQQEFTVLCRYLVEDTMEIAGRSDADRLSDITKVCRDVMCATAGVAPAEAPEPADNQLRQCRQTTFINETGTAADMEFGPFENRRKCCPITLTMQKSCSHGDRCVNDGSTIKATALADLLWTRGMAQPNIPAFSGLGAYGGSTVDHVKGVINQAIIAINPGRLRDDGVNVTVEPGGSLLEPSPTEGSKLLGEFRDCKVRRDEREAGRRRSQETDAVEVSATFDAGDVLGLVAFTDVVGGSGVTATINLCYADGRVATSGHNWHVHQFGGLTTPLIAEDICPNGSPDGCCWSAGGHFDHHRPSVEGDGYACDPAAPADCYTGDMSGKLGAANIGAPLTLAAAPAAPQSLFFDNRVDAQVCPQL